MEPGLRHHRKQPDGFERNRLAAGIRPGDHNAPDLAARGKIKRHAAAAREKGVPALLQLQRLTVREDCRNRGKLRGELRLCERRVEGGHRLNVNPDFGRAAVDCGGEGVEDAANFIFLFDLEGMRFPEQPGDGRRFDEDGPSGAADADDCAGDLVFALFAHREDIAPVSDRDEAVGEQILLGTQKVVELLSDLAVDGFQLPPDIPKGGACLGEDGAVLNRTVNLFF